MGAPQITTLPIPDPNGDHTCTVCTQVQRTTVSALQHRQHRVTRRATSPSVLSPTAPRHSSGTPLSAQASRSCAPRSRAEADCFAAWRGCGSHIITLSFYKFYSIYADDIHIRNPITNLMLIKLYDWIHSLFHSIEHSITFVSYNDYNVVFLCRVHYIYHRVYFGPYKFIREGPGLLPSHASKTSNSALVQRKRRALAAREPLSSVASISSTRRSSLTRSL